MGALVIANAKSTALWTFALRVESAKNLLQIGATAYVTLCRRIGYFSDRLLR